MGTGHVVDTCSGAYKAGVYSGYAWEAGTAAGAVRGGLRRGTKKTLDDFLPEARGRLAEAEAKYGSADVVAMAKKADIKSINHIVREAGLNKEQRQLLHREITGQGYSKDEILEIAADIAQQFPKGGR